MRSYLASETKPSAIFALILEILRVLVVDANLRMRGEEDAKNTLVE